MRNKSLFFAAAASAALLATGPAVGADSGTSAEWREVAYSCESGQPLTVAFRPSGSAVRVIAPDAPAVKLNARPAKNGFRFSDSRHELRGDGEAVTWKIGSRTFEKCSSEDPAALNLAAKATR